MVFCIDELSSSPVDRTAADAGAEETGGTKSSRDEIMSGSDAGSPSVKCTDLDDEEGISADVDVARDCAEPHLSTTSASSLPARSRRLDRGSSGSDSNLWESEDHSSPEGQRRCNVRTADSQLQVSPKRMKFQPEDNADSDPSDENDDDAARAKMSQ